MTSNVGAKSVEEPLELIRAYVQPDDQAGRDIRPMFTLDDLPGSFEGAMPRWYELSRDLEPALVVYFGTYYDRPKYRDDELLLLVVAAESYHRLSSFFPPETRSKKERERWETVLRSAPTEVKGWLERGIKRALEKRLYERLDDIAEHAGPLGQQIAKRIPSFANTIANWRNRLIHYDPSKDSASLNGAQMAHSCFVLRSLLTACLLRDIGVDETQIEVILRSSRLVQHALELNPWEGFRPA